MEHMVSTTEEIVDRLKVRSVVLGGQHVGVEVFPNQQTALLEQIAASLERIEGLLTSTPVRVADAMVKAHTFTATGLRDFYSLDEDDSTDD